MLSITSGVNIGIRSSSLKKRNHVYSEVAYSTVTDQYASLPTANYFCRIPARPDILRDREHNFLFRAAALSQKRGKVSSKVLTIESHKSLPDRYSPTFKTENPVRLLELSRQIGGALMQSATFIALVAAFALQIPGLSQAAESGGRMGGDGFAAKRQEVTVYEEPQYEEAQYIPSYVAPAVYDGDEDLEDLSGGEVLVLGALIGGAVLMAGNSEGDGDNKAMTIVKVQVGLLGMARSLQLDLNRIAECADSDSEEGRHFILNETVISLLRSPQYWAYGGATSISAQNLDAAEEQYRAQEMGERRKIKKETLVNVNNRRSEAEPMEVDESSGVNQFIVVTIVAAVEGSVPMPKIEGTAGLEEALTRLSGARSDQVVAVEVLWTPQDLNDTLTSDEVLQDYPTLFSL